MPANTVKHTITRNRKASWLRYFRSTVKRTHPDLTPRQAVNQVRFSFC